MPNDPKLHPLDQETEFYCQSLVAVDSARGLARPVVAVDVPGGLRVVMDPANALELATNLVDCAEAADRDAAAAQLALDGGVPVDQLGAVTRVPKGGDQ